MSLRPRQSMTARLIDGKAAAALRCAPGSRRGREVPGARGRAPAWPSCWSARIRPARSTSAPRARRRSKPAWTSFEHKLPPTRDRGRAARADRSTLNADEGRRNPGPAAAAGHIDADKVLTSDRSGQGRRRLPPGQRRAAGDRPRGASSPARRSAASSCCEASSGDLGARTRWSSAAPTSSASRWRCCCSAIIAP